MRIQVNYVISVGLWLALAGGGAAAQKASLPKCQQLKNKVEQLSQLRRTGGRASQMEKWKRQLRQAKEDYEQGECDDYAGELN